VGYWMGGGEGLAKKVGDPSSLAKMVGQKRRINNQQVKRQEKKRKRKIWGKEKPALGKTELEKTKNKHKQVGKLPRNKKGKKPKKAVAAKKGAKQRRAHPGEGYGGWGETETG